MQLPSRHMQGGVGARAGAATRPGSGAISSMFGYRRSYITSYYCSCLVAYQRFPQGIVSPTSLRCCIFFSSRGTLCILNAKSIVTQTFVEDYLCAASCWVFVVGCGDHHLPSVLESPHGVSELTSEINTRSERN